MTVQDRPAPPFPVIADEPPWLAAYGDDHQLMVYRSPALRYTDPMWCPVAEHIERHDMVMIDRYSQRDPAWMFGGYEATWHVVPQARIGLLAGGIGELPR